MPAADYVCEGCGLKVEHIAAEFPDEVGSLHRVGSSQEPCMGVFKRVWSFGVGRVPGAGNSPSRASK